MPFLSSIKNAIVKLDFFRTSEYFRFKSQPQYKSFFGGFVSLLLITGLLVMFSSKVFDTVQKIIITSDSSNLNAADPSPFNISTYPEDKFMFGVQIWHHNLNSGKRFFDLTLTNIQYDTGEPRNSSKTYPLEACTMDHWDSFPTVQQDYERLSMNHWLCLPKNMKYNIQGKYASVFSQTLQVAVKKCTNESNPSRPCASQAQIDTFFREQGPFYFTIYFINPLINPTSEDYLTFYLEDNNYIIFTDSFGSEGILFTQEYSVITDESIWPFAEYRQDKGGIVTNYALKNPFEIQGDVYCFFAFFKSGNTIHIDRNFQKIDEVLSYIGGLFGTLTICLFFIKKYNEASFQIRLGASLFQIKNESEEKILKNFNFFRYVSTGLYKFLASFGCTLNWKSCSEYDQSREEMGKQLDVLYLLKRLIFLEKAITSLLEEHQIKGIHLHEKLTLKEAKTNRKYFKAKKKLIQLGKKSQQKSPQSSAISAVSPQENFSYPMNLNGDNRVSNLNDLIAERYNSQDAPSFKRAKTKELKTVFVKSNTTLKEDSESSIDSEVSQSEDILNEMNQLKREAKKGDPVSKKIWMKFDEQIREDITRILKTQGDFTESQKDRENISQDSDMQFYKFVESSPLQAKSKFKKKLRDESSKYEGHLQILSRTEAMQDELGDTKMAESLNERKNFSPKDSGREAKRNLRFLVTNDS